MCLGNPSAHMICMISNGCNRYSKKSKLNNIAKSALLVNFPEIFSLGFVSGPRLSAIFQFGTGFKILGVYLC